MAKKRVPRETLSKKRDPRVDSDPPAPRPSSPALPFAPLSPSTTPRPASSARSPSSNRPRASSATTGSGTPTQTSGTSAERREIRANSPTPPDRQSARTAPSPRQSPQITNARPSDAPPRLAPERILTGRPMSPARISILEEELTKERSERAAEADTIAEMLVRVTTLEGRAKSAESALERAERDAETKMRAAKEQGGGLARKIEDAEGRIAELESELRTAKAKNADLEKKAKRASADEDLEQRLKLAQSAIEKSSDRARESEERSLELLDRVSSLQAELSSAQQIAADARARHDDQQQKYDALYDAHGSASAAHVATHEKLAAVVTDLETTHEKLAASEERKRELETMVGALDEKLRNLVTERTRLEQEHAAFAESTNEKTEAHLREHASLGEKHGALITELATTREHYEKALADARRTEASRVAGLEAKNEDTRKVLEARIEEAKKSLANEQQAHAELRQLFGAVQTEAAATSRKLIEASQERDRVSNAMTSLAERVALLETRETSLFGQLGVATAAFQRATAVFDELEARETELAATRVRDFSSLREALRTSFAGVPRKKSLSRAAPAMSSMPPVTDITDITEDAELLPSMSPPKGPSAPPDPETEGWDEDDDDEMVTK